MLILTYSNLPSVHDFLLVQVHPWCQGHQLLPEMMEVKRMNANDQHQKEGQLARVYSITIICNLSPISRQESMFSITFGPGNPGKPSSPCRGKCIHTLNIICIITVTLNECITAFVLRFVIWFTPSDYHVHKYN